MASIIRQPTYEERHRVRLLSDGRRLLNDYEFVKQAEEEGFRYTTSRDSDSMLVLMPSGDLLEWDRNPESLDSLEYRNKEELKKARQLAMVFACWQSLCGGRLY